MNTCKNCKYWRLHPEAHATHGECKCPKFVYTVAYEELSADSLSYWDYDEYEAGFSTGSDFGCIHFTPNNIEIMNLKDETPKEAYDFYIDRRSPVGNPYTMVDEKDRIKVCDNYIEHFNRMIECKDTQFVGYLETIKKALQMYGKVRLFCWCAPSLCHGETIKQWLCKNG